MFLSIPMNIFNLIKQYSFILRERIFRKGKPFVYVALGDSTVEGIGASTKEKSFAPLVFKSLQKKIKNSQYVNLGVGGAKISDVVGNQLDKAIEVRPDLIVISIGANDITNRTKLSKFKQDFSVLVETLNKRTKAFIVINNIPDMSLAPAVPRVTVPYVKVQLRRFNEVIKNQSVKVRGILIDLYTQSQFYEGYKELVSSDGFHPSDIGYALWAHTIITRISPLIQKLSN